MIVPNKEQGMIRQWQNLSYKDRFAHSHQINFDFVKVAGSMGLQARRLADPKNMTEALQWLIKMDSERFSR